MSLDYDITLVADTPEASMLGWESFGSLISASSLAYFDREVSVGGAYILK